MAEQFAARARRATAPRRAAARSRRPSSALDGRDGDIVVVLGRQSLAESADVGRAGRGGARRAARREVPLGAAPGQRARRARARASRPASCPAGSRSTPAATTSPRVGQRPRAARARRRRHPRRAAADGSIDTLVAARRRARAATSPTASACSAGLDAVPLRRRGRRVRRRRRRAAPTCSCPCRCGARRPAAAPTSKGGCSAWRASSRPRGTTMDDWRIAAGARDRASAPTSASTPSKTCRTRSPASLRPSPASTPSCVRRARDGAVLPIADFPDEIVFQQVLGVTTGRVVGADQAGVAADESHLRRSAPARSRPAAPVRPDQARLASGEPGRTTRPPTSGRGRGRRRTRPPDAPRMGPLAHGAGRRAAGRVQSPPRGRPHALRRRSSGLASSPVVGDARHRRRAWSCTRATSAASASSAEGDDVRVTTPRGTVDGVRCAPTPPPRPAPRSCRSRRAAPSARTTSSTSRRPSPSCAWRRRGERASRLTVLSLTDPLFDRGIDTHGRADHHRQDDRGVRAPAAVGADVHLVPAQGDRQDAEPDRPRPRRPVRSAAERWPTASSSSSRSSRSPPPPTGGSSASRRTWRSCPRSSRSASCRSAVLVTIAGHRTFLQLADLAVRHPVAPGDVGPRPLRRAARGLVVGVEVPAARFGARVGAAAQLRGCVRARDRRRARAVEHALDTRASSSKQGWDGFESIFNGDWYWLPAIVALVIFLIAAVAETNHPPFDLVEAEQELTGGFFTEYTGIRFAIFYLAEFMNVITMSCDRGHAVLRRPERARARVPAPRTAGSTRGSCRCSGSS